MAGAQDRKGLHLHHVGVDRLVRRARDDVSAGRKPGLRHAGNPERQRHHGRQVEKRRCALLEAERRGIHVAIADGNGLVDLRLFQPGGTGGPERNDQIGQGSLRGELRERSRQHHGGLDRADAGHQRFDPLLEVRPVFGIHGHDVENPASGNGFDGKTHPSIPWRPRTTIIVPVIEAISFAGPSARIA
ncbi:hypothetical protein D9M70_488280 [compost metagenome]